MNAFDKNILLFLNGFVDRWPHFDAFIGIHHPTDILAGAAIGVGLSALFHAPSIREKLYAPVQLLEQHCSGFFYAGAFLLTTKLPACSITPAPW